MNCHTRSLRKQSRPIFPSTAPGAGRWIATVVLALLYPLAAAAQSVGEDRARLQQLRAAVESVASLEDETRAALQSSLREVEDSLGRSAEFEQQRLELQQILDTGPQQIADLERRLLAIQAAPAALPRQGMEPAELEAELDQLESQRSAWTRERKRELDASAGAARLDGERRDRLTDIAVELQESKAPVFDESAHPLERQVSQLLAITTSRALQDEESTLQLALKATPQMNSLRAARIAWLDAAVKDADGLIVELQAQLAEQRGNEAAQQRAELRRLLDRLGGSVPADIQTIADDSLEYIDANQVLAADIERVRNDIAAIRAITESIEQSESLTRRRLEVAGLESELGQVMLSRLGSLPDTDRLASQRRARNERIASVSLAAIDMEQALRSLEFGGAADGAGGEEARPMVERRVLSRLGSLRR